MRNNYKCVWSSSYDRGLQYLLDMWPDIRKEVPQAELVVTYGWNLFLAAYGQGGLVANPERLAWKDTIDEKMKQEGVTHLGRIGQEDMVKLLQESGLWTYPTDFQEISCISAMKAQIYGAIPITMDYCALQETVKYGSKIKGDIADPKVQEIYKSELISWLKDHDRQKETRKVMCPWAREEFGWDKVAEEWREEFKSPRVYSDIWGKELWEKLPKELKDEQF